MFIKKITIHAKNTGKRYTYYRLCESYRIGGKPRHRNILDLGTLEELPDPKDRKILADCIEQFVYKKTTLFEITDSPKIKKLAEHFGNIIIKKGLLDIAHNKPKSTQTSVQIQEDIHSININSIEHNQVREIGAEWLCKQAIEQLGLNNCLGQLGWEEKWRNLAMIYLTGRCIFPASDLKTEDWLRRNTALAELYNMNAEKITRHHLYKVSRMLYREKDVIEKHLSVRTEELFSSEDKILLHDFTNTYFEGRKEGSQKARFGPGKDKGFDAKIIALAMVVNAEGFARYSHFYPGNIKEHKTLEKTLIDIEKNIGKSEKKRIVVIDAGIGTEDNLRLLRERGYDYVSVSLSKMSNYEVVDSNAKKIELQDRLGNKIYVQWVKVEGKQDHILQVKSQGKQLKEVSMYEQFCKRYEEGLTAIKEGITKKGGVKKTEKVYERLGRLKEKYPSVHRYYKITIKSKKGIVKEFSWTKEENPTHKHGVYFIRTSLDCKDEKTIWKIYNTIREIEATFRVLKTDLKMRPIFHQRDIYTESHLFGSVLAYSIVHAIRHQLKAHGEHSDWSNIVRTMNTQKVITTTMKTQSGKTIYLKKCSEPESDVRRIYQLLKYQDRPFWQKKSVLPKNENPNSHIIDSS